MFKSIDKTKEHILDVKSNELDSYDFTTINIYDLRFAKRKRKIGEDRCLGQRIKILFELNRFKGVKVRGYADERDYIKRK